jgi:capsular polysaccharide biosynthesis protein
MMSRLVKLLVRLYPSSWRNRYEAEFEALLEEVQPGWRASIDILKEALSMQLKTVHFGNRLVLLGVLGFFAALIPSYFIKDQYVSSAVIKIQSLGDDWRQVPHTGVDDQMKRWLENTFSNQSLGRLIDKFRLYPKQQGKEPLEDTIARMRNQIEIRSIGKDEVRLQFRYYDRLLAKRVAEDLADDLVDRSHKPATEDRLFDLGILDPVQMATSPVYPARLRIGLYGLAAGLVFGVVIAFLRRLPEASQE